MPASLQRTRNSITKHVTHADKSVTLNVPVTAYDNGMIAVLGIPINKDNKDGFYDPVVGWTGALQDIVQTVNEFRKTTVAERQARRRRVK